MNQSPQQAGGHEIRVSGKVIRTGRIHGDLYRFIDSPEPIVADLRRSGARIDLFTFVPRLPCTSPQYSYPMEWDNLAVLEVKSFDHWWTTQVNNKTRNMARQAERKGVILREVEFDDSLAEGIWRIYNETPIRQGRKFFNFGKTLDTVKREAGTFLDCSVFIGAFFEDKLIGFAKLIIDETGTQAGLVHIISMVQYRQTAPTNALIAQAVRVCADRGIRYLVYSNFAYGNKAHDGLSDFKEHNGFKRFDVPRYYIPITRVGQVALLLGLHLSLHHHVPEALIAAYRKYRSWWYSRRYSTAAVASRSSKRVTEA